MRIGAGAVSIRAATVAVPGFSRSGHGVHQSETDGGKTQGGKKLSAVHGVSPFARKGQMKCCSTCSIDCASMNLSRFYRNFFHSLFKKFDKI